MQNIKSLSYLILGLSMDAVNDYIKSSEKPEPLPPGDLNVFIF